MAEKDNPAPPESPHASGRYHLKLDEITKNSESEIAIGKVELTKSVPPTSDEFDDSDRVSQVEVQVAAQSLSTSVDKLVEALLAVLGKQTALATAGKRHERLLLTVIGFLFLNLFVIAAMLWYHATTLQRLDVLVAKQGATLTQITSLQQSSSTAATSSKKVEQDLQEIKSDKADIHIVPDKSPSGAKIIIRQQIKATPAASASVRSIEIPIKLPKNADMQVE